MFGSKAKKTRNFLCFRFLRTVSQVDGVLPRVPVERVVEYLVLPIEPEKELIPGIDLSQRVHIVSRAHHQLSTAGRG